MMMVDLVALLLPRKVRGRFAEEWRADLAGAQEIGIRRSAVLWGAFITAVSVDRRAEGVTGVTMQVLGGRRLRWAGAFLACLPVVGVGSTFWSGPAGSPQAVIGALQQSLAVAFLVSALIMTAGGVAAGLKVSHPLTVLGQTTCSAIALVVAGFTGVPVPVLLASIGGVILLQILVALDITNTDSLEGGTSGIMGLVVALLAVVALGCLHILMWNPQAVVPGMPLTQIYTALQGAGQGNGIVAVSLWATFWLAAAIAFAVVGVRARTGGGATLVGLGMVGGACATAWLAGTPTAMSLADTFAVTGEDAAPSGLLLNLVGQIALIGAVVWGVAPQPADQRTAGRAENA